MNISTVNGNWIRGTVTVNGRTYAVSAKVYPEPSEIFGISELGGSGHISKLDVTDEADGERVMAYDRGWDFNLIPKTGREIVSRIEGDDILDAVDKNL